MTGKFYWYKMRIMRRNIFKRLALCGIVFIVSFYGSIFLLGDLKVPRMDKLTSLDRCPACYGVSVCPELYSQHIILERLGWTNILNAKNIYYAYTTYNRRAVLKKLAHDWELRDFDARLCQIFDLKSGCRPIEAVNASKLLDKIVKIVEYNLIKPELAPRKGLVMCPYSYSIRELIKPLAKEGVRTYATDLMHIWTMLMLNPEPIILQLMPKSRGWPVPAYGGVCGRLELVAYEGEPLSSLLHLEWYRKLKLAQGILNAAMAFTFRHDRFRFYLMDWSIDNIVANKDDVITFVDLEDMIVLDKQISPRGDLPSWYQRYLRENHTGFTFSIDNICKHHLSDHNIWAACYVLAGKGTPLLYPIPEDIRLRELFNNLLQDCLNGDDRFRIIPTLQEVINEMLMDADTINNKSSTSKAMRLGTRPN